MGSNRKLEDLGFGLAITFSARVFTHIPRSWCEWVQTKTGFKVSPELCADMKAAGTYRVGQLVMNAIAEDFDPAEEKGWEGRFEKTERRTCIVAGVLDDIEKDCLERGRQLKKGNWEGRAFKVEKMRHAWNCQDPQLFPRSVKAWMDREEMPEEFLALN